MVTSLIYILCAITSFFCAALLWRSYREARSNLLLWTTLGFTTLAVNNLLLYADLVMFPQLDFQVLRGGVTLVAAMMMVYGLIWEEAR